MSAFLTTSSISDPSTAHFLTFACVVMLIVFLIQREFVSNTNENSTGLSNSLRLVISPLLLVFGIVIVQAFMATL